MNKKIKKINTKNEIKEIKKEKTNNKYIMVLK